MPYYAPQANEDFPSAREGGLDTTPTTFGQSVAASFAQGITEMPTARLPLALEHGAQSLTEPDLPVDELNQKYGIKGVLNFDKPMPARTASDLYQEKHAQALREDTMSHGPDNLASHAADFFAGQIPQFLDPINIGTSFVPGLGDARISAALGRAAETLADRAPGVAGSLARAGSVNAALGENMSKSFAGRFAAGASQGIAGQAAMEPLDYLMDKDDREDWSMSQMIRDLAFGGVLGGFAHGVFGRAHDAEEAAPEALKTDVVAPGSPAAMAADLDADGRGAVLNESLAAQSEGRDTVAGELGGVINPAAGQNSGPFGRIFKDYEGNAQGAIAVLREAQEGEAPGALYHPDVGPIDLVWGKEGTSDSNGYGLSKLIKYHPEVLNDLQGFLSRLKRNDAASGPNRIRLEDENGRAAVSLNWLGNPKKWLLTAYEKGAGNDARMDTAAQLASDDTPSRGTGKEKSGSVPTLGGNTRQMRDTPSAYRSSDQDIAQDVEAFHQKASQDAATRFKSASQSAVMTPPRPEAAAASETANRAANAPVVETGGIEEAQKALDAINERLGIGSEHSALPDEALADLEKIDAMRKEDEGWANALQAAGACFARNL